MTKTDQDKSFTLKSISNVSNWDNHNVTGAIFLVGVTGIFFFSGFSSSIATLRKKSPKLFNKGLCKDKNYSDTGTDLALRALKWGSFYSIMSCSLIFYGIWNISGATSFAEFRHKMRRILPKISNDPSLQETN